MAGVAANVDGRLVITEVGLPTNTRIVESVVASEIKLFCAGGTNPTEGSTESRRRARGVVRYTEFQSENLNQNEPQPLHRLGACYKSITARVAREDP